ncbi:hypothetical protein [Candidatus Clostridium stratigraminis]|uniref:Protein kinase domain-containing protein n=1 Tax=Candidatus Clostridium stratigraminis TaxID=3381661 RepID=A0ABW8T691_9CLOT
MLKIRNKKKHKVIKVLQFHNMKMDHYRDTKTDDFTKELEEETLEKYVKDRNSLKAKDIYNITLSICETITNLTNLKYYIQCCQLDPANILISKNEEIFIKDFGFSNGLLINDATVPYLPNFVSSYVKQQNIHEDSSEKVICTIGMLMYYMATGKAMITCLDPFLEDSYDISVDSNLKRIIQKCFHIDVTRRYVSIEELKNEIIIECIKKSKYRKAENLEDHANASGIAQEYHYFKRVNKYKRNNLNSLFSKISSTLSTFF